MINIILCGGSGTRLWPISRTLMPKQFVKLFADKSLFQLTVERNAKICNRQMIVSNTEQYFLALDQLAELQQTNNQYLLEPIARNTAPAIALACMALVDEGNGDEMVLVTPSDHLIKDETAYQSALQQAQKLAQANNLVTFGIAPTFAETGFGYIEADEFSVLAFHEKPNLQTAQRYLEAGNYYWNSGMFMFKASLFLAELKAHSLPTYEAVQTAFKNANKNEIIRINHNDMSNIPDNSIDYAVMEKSDKVKVIPANIGWSDVGSFDALFNELPKDENNNTLNENHIAIDSKNNLIYGKERKIATIDIQDIIVVDTGDALLISKKGSSQKVKQVVAEVKKTTELHNIHLTGHRPWGTYTVLEEAEGYKIKRIEVLPNKRLSLQSHQHRNEHWVVIKGRAEVVNADKMLTLCENESTYIKAGDKHRLSNTTNEVLIIIEVQVGSYMGEDDIKRFDDIYGRD